MVGGCVSRTITRCVHELVLPLVSVTVHVTVLVPSGKLAGALLVTEATAQLSPVTGMPRLTPVAEQELVLAETVTSAGQMMVGGSGSFTVTVNEQVLVLPLASVTTKRLVVTPFGKVAPLVSPAVCARVAPGQLSPEVTT